MSLAPYRHGALCPQHAPASIPPCPRCAQEWLGHAPPPPTQPPPWAIPPLARRTFLAGLCAATAFGAVIGTAIGFVAGASPVWAATELRLAPTGVTAAGTVPRSRAPREVAPLPRVPAPRRPALPAVTRTAPPIAALTPLLAEVGERTSDPERLLARLQGLARSGVPVVIETRRLPARVVAALRDGGMDLHGVRVLPAEQDGRVVGLKVYGRGAGDLLREAGLQSGDLVLAVNGHEVATPGWPPSEPFPGDARVALVELVREGELRVIVVRW